LCLISCYADFICIVVVPEKHLNVLISLAIVAAMWYRKLQGKPDLRGETLQYEAEEKA
jgi:hypothetical protein